MGKKVGVAPGIAVDANGRVAELGWSETITERGTAVGFVARRENEKEGVAEGVPVAGPATAVDPGPTPAPDPVATPGTDAVPAGADDAPLAAAIIWRAWLACMRSPWAATRAGRATRRTGLLNFMVMVGGRKGG